MPKLSFDPCGPELASLSPNRSPRSPPRKHSGARRRRRQTVSLNRKAGKLMVFQGAKGGVGVTTLATNFAVAIARENAGEVVLVDLHPQLGEIALGLGMTPRFSIADALENSTRLDWDFLSTLLTKHDSGLMVLSSADEYGVHRSLERGTEKLLRILQEEFAYVVVDNGSCSGSTPEALFEMADTIYLVSEVSLPALRNARRVITEFEARGRSFEVILNRFNSRRVEIDEESATKALSRAVDWKIPNDYMAVRGAQNLGVPLVMQDTQISRAVCQMANGACRKLQQNRDHTPLRHQKGDKIEVLDFEKYKATIHGALLSRIDLEKLASADSGKARQAVAVLIQEIVLLERVPLNASEKDHVESDLLDEVLGWARSNHCCGIRQYRTFW